MKKSKDLLGGKRLYLIGFLVVLIDRIFKIIYWGDYRLNTGAAFGVLKGWNLFLILIGIAIIGVIIYSRKHRELEIGLGFLLGGTLSNLIDRVVYGGVIDYIHLTYIFSIFNLGDVANIIGALILVYKFWGK